MVSDAGGGINVPIYATDEATAIVERVMASLIELGVVTDKTFANLTAGAGAAQIKLERLAQEFFLMAAKASGSAEGVDELKRAIDGLRALEKAAQFEVLNAQLERTEQKAREAAAAYSHFGMSQYQAAYLSATAPPGMSKSAAAYQSGVSGLQHFGINDYMAEWQRATAAINGNDAIQRMQEMGVAADRVGTRMRQAGMNISTGFTLPMALIGGASIAAATSFDNSMTLIETQAGATRKEVDFLKAAVLDLSSSGQVTQGPNELADALFDIESVGIRGQAALDTLKAAAMGATTGQADLTEVTVALTSALASQIEGASGAQEAMANINAIVGVGRIRMDEFVKSLGTGVLPVAKQLGLSLNEVGASIDVLTNAGIPAAQASTRLRTSFLLMAAPTDKAEAALKQIGLTSLEVGTIMREQGLIPALELIKQRLAGFSSDATAQADVIVQAFGGSRSASTIITLLDELEQLKTVYDGIQDNQSKFAEQYERSLERFGAKWDIFVSKLQSNAIKLGNAMMPGALFLMDVLGPAIDKLVMIIDKLPPSVQTAVSAFLVLVALSGPLLVIGGALVTIYGNALIAAAAILRLASAASMLNLALQAFRARQFAMGFQAMGAALNTPIGALAALTAGIVAYDMISRGIGGGGIAEIMGDSRDKAAAQERGLQRATEAMNAYNHALKEGASQQIAFKAGGDDIANELTKNFSELMATVEERQKYLSDSSNWLIPETAAATAKVFSFGKLDFSKGEDLKREIEENQKAIDTMVERLRTSGATSQDLIDLENIFPDLGQIPEYSRLIFDLADAESKFAAATREAKIASGEWTDEMIDSEATLTTLITKIDGYAQAIDDAQKIQSALDPEQEALKVQIAAYESLQAAAAAIGQPTKEYDDILAGLNLRLDEFGAKTSLNNALISLYVSALQESSAAVARNYVELDNMGMSVEAARGKALQFSQILATLPEVEQIRIQAILPFLEMHRLAKLIDDIVNKKYSIEIALKMATMTPRQMTEEAQQGAIGPDGNITFIPRARQDEINRQALYDIYFEEQQKISSGAGAVANAEKGPKDELNKTEFGLLSLAEAFKIFNDQTGSESIPAFKAWLEMQKGLVEATEKHTAALEIQQNPLLQMIMALGAIRQHILEANITIEQFLRDQVFMPALNNFKSELDKLFNQPTRETMQLELEKDQLELQRLQRKRSGATDKELKDLDRKIESINREIEIRNKAREIEQDRISLLDKTMLTEEDLFNQAQLLATAIDITSQKVIDLQDAVFFQALAALNAGNALNLVADAAYGLAGGAPGGATTGAAVGGYKTGWTWVGESGAELVNFGQSGAHVFTARDSARMAGGGTNIEINLQVAERDNGKIKEEVMRALDNALFAASYGGSFVDSSTYRP